MLTPEQVEGLQVAFEQLAQPLNDYLIRDIARRVSQAGQFTSTAAYQIWRLQEMGTSRDDIEKAVAAIMDKTVPEVQALFQQAADVGYSFDISHLPREAIPFATNTSVQQIVAAAVKLAENDLRNITQTMGFKAPDGTVSPLLDAYQKTTDFAFSQVITGAADYNTAIRLACDNLAAGGIRTIDYASGIHTGIEAAIRRNMMGGLGLMVEQISQQNHDDLGCNGWEISAHAASAPDHEPIQGRQYSDEAYKRLNDSLKRRIGTLNCGHNASPIILGVSSPQYSPEELEQFRQDNAKGVVYEGRQFDSVYEATQYQRRIERSIRAQKNRVLTAEATGDKERLTTSKIRLNRLNEEYRRFSRTTGLPTQDERLWVSGFGGKKRAEAKNIEKAKKPAILNNREERAVAAYISGDSYRLNSKLRDGTILAPEEIEIMEGLDSALEKMPIYKGKVIRSLVLDKESLMAFAKGHTVGTQISYPAYTSSSTHIGYHKNPTVILQIQSKTGRDIRTFNPHEREILFPRNSRFQIVNAKLEEGVYILEMEEIS